jgi:hypothetical protein
MDMNTMQQTRPAGLETGQAAQTVQSTGTQGSLLPGNLGFTVQGGGVIGTEQVEQARQTLNKYKEGKKNLEQKVIDAEQWYKLRNWECMRKDSKIENQVEPVSGWLFNAITNKHGTAMDNYPAPNILPREEGDRQEAKILSSIVPVLLEKCDFEQVYNDEVYDKLIGGTGIFGVYWDGSKLGGLGDVSIERVDVLNLFWQPGISDIQQSRNVFHVTLRDNDSLTDEFPELEGKLGKSTIDLGKYQYDDQVDTTDSSAVVDWYYRKRNTEGKVVLHYCKFVNDTVIFATENDPNYAERGWYDHGMYPFVFDTLFPMKGTPCGFGFVDVAKSPQEYIDRGNQAIMENMLANSRPRFFIRNDGGVNEEEYADTNKPFVHTEGGLGDDSITPIQGKHLSGIYVNVIQNKVDELKETTGNRDISNGGSQSGVTAASAIAAMQEAGSKIDRDSSKSTYRAFRKVCVILIELIRQFYDMPRQFRIVGESGMNEFVSYSNAGIQPQDQGEVMGVDMGYRVPEFDITVSAEKRSPYSKLSQNELALQFYGAGFFQPENAQAALMCLEMMDFDRKEIVMNKIAQNGSVYQQMMGMMGGLAQAGAAPGLAAMPQEQEAQTATAGESGVTQSARERVADSTVPT